MANNSCYFIFTRRNSFYEARNLITFELSSSSGGGGERVRVRARLYCYNQTTSTACILVFILTNQSNLRTVNSIYKPQRVLDISRFLFLYPTTITITITTTTISTLLVRSSSFLLLLLFLLSYIFSFPQHVLQFLQHSVQ